MTVLVVLGLYAGTAAWFPWVNNTGRTAPGWAISVGLDHPFKALPFLLLIALLFASTLTCTLLRIVRTWRLSRGILDGGSMVFQTAALDEELVQRLDGLGYRGDGTLFFRNRHALWGGSVLHIGIVILLGSVAVQQLYADGGSFELAEGEALILSQPGAIIQRERGKLAPSAPPPIRIALTWFDPYQHQPGYAPDRLSRLAVLDDRIGTEKVVNLDRAHGATVGGTSIYHAIPTGFALQLELSGKTEQVLHLRQEAERKAAGDFTTPGEIPLRLVLETEHPLDDPHGIGSYQIRVESRLQNSVLMPGMPFLFGNEPARLVGLVHWAGFTYARSPGIGGVFLGFGIVMTGSLLLMIPSGVLLVRRESGVMIVIHSKSRDTLSLGEALGLPERKS
jgi:hypothetical protein